MRERNLVAEHFDRVAPTWGQRYSPSGSMRKRIDRFVSEVQKSVPPGSVGIDFGCGTGDITDALRRAGYQMTGFDPSGPMVQIAQERFPDTTFQVLPDGAPITMRGDFAIASSVFEYLSDPAANFRILRAALKHGAPLFVTVPAGRWWETAIRPFSWLAPFVPLKRIRNYLEYLRISRNRWSIREWEQEAKDYDLAGVDHAPLTMLCFRAR